MVTGGYTTRVEAEKVVVEEMRLDKRLNGEPKFIES